ncbi:uncharacterized protein LOC124437952 [Xenia sp. Carnegie-2017]|uniref:uncharacterized protein LOC124437952 n=1 Tax=Xenia sp. Carnegie-2017 TaxID=2897299 RepID=UPI001F04020B|nr:uncharacterized protein LOC124437952 [Xenia sp. Carnegie-2017]
MLCKVGNQQPIKKNDALSSVVLQLNSEPSDWKSQMDSDVYDYFCTYEKNGKINKTHYNSSKYKPLLQESDAIIKDQVKGGIIDSVLVAHETGYFLPHHGVLRKDKETTKLRVVFDGSARVTKEEQSLNHCIEKGPNFVHRLFDTMINFRGFSIGLVADIEKAFHEIQIAPEDRRMQLRGQF